MERTFIIIPNMRKILTGFLVITMCISLCACSGESNSNAPGAISIFEVQGERISGYEISEEQDVILLSPSCASWDQYKCMEDRGNEFKRVINELK